LKHAFNGSILNLSVEVEVMSACYLGPGMRQVMHESLVTSELSQNVMEQADVIISVIDLLGRRIEVASFPC
jgi:hypothetical protein